MKTERSDENVRVIAAACHQANRAWCQAHGDRSHVHWSKAPEWQKASMISGVHGVLDGNGPADSHAQWMAEKKADGWKYGEIKNAGTKVHPCMVPYSDLPDTQKAKDDLFVSTVRELADLFWPSPDARVNS